MSVGQCNPDHNAIARFLNSLFECKIIRISTTEEAIESLKEEKVDLVLVNRKLDMDYTDGMILIEKMQKDLILKDIPVMLISNYPEYQEEAMKLGARRGFGKSELQLEESKNRVANVLS